MRRGSPVSSRLYTHRHDEKGFPRPRRVSIHTDYTQTRREGLFPFSSCSRRGFPLLVVFLSTMTRREGGNPVSSHLYTYYTQTRREGLSTLLVVFLSTKTRREGGNPVSSLYTRLLHTDTTRGALHPSRRVFI
jgi:hypothetical protein